PVRADLVRRARRLARARPRRERLIGRAETPPRRPERHHSPMARIWSSASGVVRTGRLTSTGGAARPQLPRRAEDGRPRPIPMTLTPLHAERAGRLLSGRRPRRQVPDG
ncbi:MAG: hypothetical protein U0236_23090, partial [Nitrospira sp.]